MTEKEAIKYLQQCLNGGNCLDKECIEAIDMAIKELQVQPKIFEKGCNAGAKWNTLKALKWLEEHILDYVYAKEYGQGVGVEEKLFEDFEKAME